MVHESCEETSEIVVVKPIVIQYASTSTGWARELGGAAKTCYTNYEIHLTTIQCLYRCLPES